MEKLQRLPADKKDDIDFNYEEEIFRSLLEEKEVLRVHVHKSDDIASLL